MGQQTSSSLERGVGLYAAELRSLYVQQLVEVVMFMSDGPACDAGQPDCGVK